MTEQHYLKEELYQLVASQPEIFDFLQRGSLDGLWYWDLKHPEVEWMNERFWELLGYDPAEMKHLASEWQDLIHPDDLNVALSNFEKHCADPSHPYDQVVRYRHKKGHTVWVRCRGIAIRDEHGKPVRMLGAHNDLTALYELQGRLQELAYKDPLTQLANRNAFLEHFDWTINNFRRKPESLSLALIDVDDFKSVNDRHGHQAGDKVLAEVADAIRRACRGNDYAARWGGEEFVILFHDTDQAEGLVVAERLRSEVEGLAMLEHPLTASIGLSTPAVLVEEDSRQILDHFLREADKAVYMAKTNGKNNVVHYTEMRSK
ncbi:MAG TPA: sensor domain-containing diguanylate cyclase [Wenzhouxiangella sp.]|nr:sensor domain-containing diguanylate cyclase [Wenzhouxiangella sp.]